MELEQRLSLVETSKPVTQMPPFAYPSLREKAKITCARTNFDSSFRESLRSRNGITRPNRSIFASSFFSFFFRIIIIMRNGS